jgi:hypothetical protein
MTVKMRLIKPWAHQLFVEGQTSPVYMDCTLDLCRICHKIEVAKNFKALDDLVKARKASWAS